MSSLLILAAGGHGKVVADSALASGLASTVSFLDDHNYSHVMGWPVIGPLDFAFNPLIKEQFPLALVAIGDPALRLSWLNRLKAFGYVLPVLIHPTAWVSPTAELAAGTVVLSHSSIQAQVVTGIGVILNTGSSVDHDSLLGDGVHICPGARLAGGVTVGDRTWIGIGASVIQQICIGSDVTVGAGSAVVRDLCDGVTAVGVPARVLPTV